ncbi:MAG: hypothetical protein A2381_15195 [Bdellovibrionales bacterium RIFOXYB1_FULL_37_110]|nr:MAG: hypothetical protein A2381_15195 [Bdellovibrionales bacterium RIFOXYB1_FULL_37_110]
MNMSKMILVMIGVGMFSGCVIPPGTVAIETSVCGDMPDAERYTVVRSGRVWSGPCTEIYTLPTREQRAVWTLDPTDGSPNDESITFAGVDGQPVNADIGISYSIGVDDSSIIAMIRTYGPDLESTIDSKVRDYVRDSLNACASENNRTVQDLYGVFKTETVACAQERTQKEFGPNGLVINRLTLNSEIRLPAKIKQAMEMAQAATQEADRVSREVQMTEAEARKQLVSAQADADSLRIRSESEAEANRIITQSLTKEVLELRRLEVEEALIGKWNGSVPTTVLSGESNMLYNIGK